jgi:hypothetical protein
MCYKGRLCMIIPIIVSIVNYFLDNKHHKELKYENSQQSTSKLHAVIFHFSIHVSVQC